MHDAKPGLNAGHAVETPGPDCNRTPSPNLTPELTRHRDAGLVWLMGHAARVWPLVAVAIVLGSSWGALRQIHPAAVGRALHSIDRVWLSIAVATTALNVAVMGLYDVVAIRGTRAPWAERWRYGAVAFAWSNFLTLGPLAGPAIRLWLYRPWVDHLADLRSSVFSMGIAFTSGLIGWTVAVLVVPRLASAGPWLLSAAAYVFALILASLARALAARFERLALSLPTQGGVARLALVGWLDWMLAALAFLACLRTTARTVANVMTLRSFFLGQAIGVASLVPGGFGGSDAFWIAHLPLPESTAAAGLVIYRFIYYVLPWVAALLLLLSWATRRAARGVDVARRIVAGMVGAAGALILLSAASPAIAARLAALQHVIPLLLVEFGHLTAALTGVLLLVLARALARGYRAALLATIIVLTAAGLAAMLKGLDWEEAVVLETVALAAWSQSPLFDRPSKGRWLERGDLGVAVTALSVFLVFGALAHRVSADTLARWTRLGYHFESARFVRSAGSLIIAVSAAALYVLLRAPVRFARPSDDEIDRVLRFNEQIGHSATPLTVANGDKAVFMDDQRGFCLYRTAGPYLVVLSDPVIRSEADRSEFLDGLFSLAIELDRRLLFYQISPDWIPSLHDRGYLFFKLGEEAQVPLDRITLDGPSGKLYRQILRRADREQLSFRIVEKEEVEVILTELSAVSMNWLRSKGMRERQFSVGFFDEAYLRRFPCAVVEETGPRDAGQPGDDDRRIVAFANILAGPRHEELSVDLMRQQDDAPRGKVMDFLLLSLFLHGKAEGYQRFNLGMTPLASVGAQKGAHLHERLANLLFQHGEHWYNFQGLRRYKEKFGPDWIPRYMAYQSAWDWPTAVANVSALIAGGWSRLVVPSR